ncbi:hypothetical protein PSA7680_03367 [Pseudoruegeria aquimaris]|uniref:Uncharacterized protein n=1 Tax=Pseudoruegeria aquimaris TaxID=393663 RepID=A0A1Y5TMH5_9RHOB|nr:hypothetical protein [Pseudoruegeria aquimaris]SLN63652.1 hypothetical protein PSA7680_03367 [Pseudoruegeria aquimaris]
MVGTAQYSHLNCNQIIRERNRVVTSVNDLTGRQNKAATNDAVAMGVGLVLFWPALFAVGFSEDLAPQLAQMKGQYEALTQIGIERNCFDV